MFSEDENPKGKAGKVVDYLSSHSDTKTHARHIHIDEAKKIGLNITDLESDEDIQDLVLTIHHAYMHTFSSTPAIKITENQNGNAVVLTARA